MVFKAENSTCLGDLSTVRKPQVVNLHANVLFAIHADPNILQCTGTCTLAIDFRRHYSESEGSTRPELYVNHRGISDLTPLSKKPAGRADTWKYRPLEGRLRDIRSLCGRIPAFSIAGYDNNLLIFLIATNSHLNQYQIPEVDQVPVLGGINRTDQ